MRSIHARTGLATSARTSASTSGLAWLRSFVCTLGVALLMVGNAQAAIVLDEGFDNTDLLASQGWATRNNSTNPGPPGWFQGYGDIFPAYDGTPNEPHASFIEVNFESTSGSTGQTVSDWLMTPELTFAPGAQLTFWTRTSEGTQYAERLQVRLSTQGASIDVGSSATDVGDFSQLMLQINPEQTVSVYPETWTQYTITGLPTSGSGRLAFRYFLENGGQNTSMGDAIGIDRVQYDSGATAPAQVTPVPVDHPIMLSLLLAAVLVLARTQQRKP